MNNRANHSLRAKDRDHRPLVGAGHLFKAVEKALAVSVMSVAMLAVVTPFSSDAWARSYQPAPVPQTDIADPLEPFNRVFYGVNFVVDHVFLRPIAYAYRDGIPGAVRSKVTNILHNLESPVVLANDLLQGEWSRAEDTTMRFLTNSTVGLLGIFDVAGGWGYPYHEEDFGQTLAVAGVGEGPYLVLPLLGPSNARDAVGSVVDDFFDPLRGYSQVAWTRTGAAAVDSSANSLDAMEELERGSVDTYASMRSVYQQLRKRQIGNMSTGEASSAVSGSAFDFDDTGHAE